MIKMLSKFWNVFSLLVIGLALLVFAITAFSDYVEEKHLERVKNYPHIGIQKETSK